MESSLDDFSFEELSSKDAASLKKLFQSFKSRLEEKIFAPAVLANFNEQIDFYPEQDIAIPEENDEVSPEAFDENMLIARVSHEIRTPLNGIVGFTDLLKESELNHKQTELVNAIQTTSSSLMEIINELLEYAKLSSGNGHFDTIDFNFHRVVQDVLYLCNTLITDKEVKLEAHIDDAIPTVLLGDPSKLTQVLLNLLGNAIKFVEKGSIHFNIKLKEQRSNTFFLEFTIADTGIGISEDHLEHIFDSFKQAEKDTYVKYGGSGLGLNIVKQIVENLGGYITVLSKLGTGTTFTFSLPYQKGDIKNIVLKNKVSTNTEDTGQQLKDKNILVFEDNLLNQKLIEQRLKTWGCNVFITDNPLHGLDLLESNTMDVVLMDLKMPVMSGFDVTERIRKSKNKAVSQIAIIALTADFSFQDNENCDLYGINDFILKPYNPDELLSKLLKNTKHMKTTLSIESSVINSANKTRKKDVIVDLSTILEDCMGEFTLLDELINLYKQNALEFIGATRIHLHNEDLEQLALVAHKIKSGLAMLHSHSLHDIVSKMQKTCKTDGDIKHLQFLYGCFLEEYPIVEKAINLELKKLKNK